MSTGVYEVAKMAVAESCQGRGIGRRLLAYTIEQGRALGADSLYLETNNKLANAVHLYESLGFEHEGRLRARRKHGDVFLDDYMMSRVRSGLGPA